ncbi:hypothetical protein AC579_2921 [Pseudocercospora musae]|uniref:Protein phosphatase 2C homolog 2 n=1 Tax=Pseudocercospora musae TaxID=113226 RepID=A0A139IU64_9PEZI|nr:hypothetical protein AC579_2921 [Pseudocercospora musae]KXT18265.1 hypothetical protein AC579_2921 [Pseudocercospora musae]
MSQMGRPAAFRIEVGCDGIVVWVDGAIAGLDALENIDDGAADVFKALAQSYEDLEGITLQSRLWARRHFDSRGVTAGENGFVRVPFRYTRRTQRGKSDLAGVKTGTSHFPSFASLPCAPLPSNNITPRALLSPQSSLHERRLLPSLYVQSQPRADSDSITHAHATVNLGPNRTPLSPTALIEISLLRTVTPLAAPESRRKHGSDVVGARSGQDEGQDDRVVFGVSAMQGWRISMEDAHAAVLDLQALEGDEELKPAAADVRVSFFGVYDGHGGDKVALYTGEHLHNIVAKQESFKNKDFEQALKDGFLAIDRAILSDPRYEEEVSGCTASVAIATKDKIYVGNAGDSRSVLGIKGRAKPLSFDHKPQNEGEKARICAAGGFVDFGRVNGNLALSRAIGDFEFKKSADLPPEQQIVTAYPDVTVHEIGDDDEFLVIACDGIWDCQSSQAVVEFVRRGIAAKQELHAICENMMDNCLASNSETGGVGCDNMTMIIVGLLRDKSKEEWYKMIGERVANGDGPCAPPEYGKS